MIHSKNGTVAALLGASPGASTSAFIALDLLQKCFTDRMQSPEWQAKLHEMVPGFGKSLSENPELCRTIRKKTHQYLEIVEKLD